MTLDSCSQAEAPPLVGSGGDATTAPAAQAKASDLPRGGSEPRTLPEICYALRRRVMAFLEEEQTGDELLRNTQGQARVSMGVIEEALRRYRWVPLPVRRLAWAVRENTIWLTGDKQRTGLRSYLYRITAGKTVLSCWCCSWPD